MPRSALTVTDSLGARAVPGSLEPSGAAFRAIYRLNFEFVWRVLRRFGVREGDVQDVLQSVFMVVYRGLPEFEHRASIRTWLFRISFNLAKDYRRSARVRREVAFEPEQLDFLSERGGTELSEEPDISLSRTRLALAEAMLKRIPESQRAVFVLFELEEMSGSEIAASLGISLGTVRSRLRLARERFASEVKQLERKRRAKAGLERSRHAPAPRARAAATEAFLAV